MKPSRLVWFVAASLLAGCDGTMGSPAGDAGSDGGSDAGGVRIFAPAGDALTNGKGVSIIVAVDQAPADVRVLLDGTKIIEGQLAADPNAVEPMIFFTWDAPASIADGVHVLQAQAVVSGASLSSAPQNLTFDRVPPSVRLVTPMLASPTVCPSDAFALSFSEPMQHWVDGGVGGAPVVLFELDDGGVLPTFPVLVDNGNTLIAHAAGPGDGGSWAGVSGGLTLITEPALQDLAGNSLQPYALTWQLDAGCPEFQP